MEIKVLAPAKINLTLDVTGKRPDGYHNILSIMQSVDLYDTITVTDNDMADRFPILAFQDRRGHSRVPSLLFVCFQKALLQAHQTYRRKEEREELPFFFL